MRRNLRSIPAGISNNVTSLSLAQNKIDTVSAHSLSRFPNLTHLDLNWLNGDFHVNLTDGVFTNLTKLKQLWLSGVGLHEVPKQLPSGLNQIRMDENKITYLNKSSFSDIKNVMNITLSKNCYSGNECNKTFYVQEKTFFKLSHLQNLILSFNNITTVPQDLPDSLIELDLSANRIESISKNDFSNLINLQFLRIQGNCPRCKNAPYPCVPCKNGSIEIHPQAFDSLSKLQVLQLAGNSLQAIESSWFKNLTNLSDLFLSFNFLINAIADGNFLVYLPRLERLDLSYNFELQAYPKTLTLSEHFSKLESLHTLHIEGYVFQEIMEDTFRPLQNLKHLSVLNIGVNFIVHSDFNAFRHLSNLTLLYLSENRLYPVTNNSASHALESSHALASSYAVASPSGLASGPIHYIKEKEFVYELLHGLIMPECFHTGRVLDLSRNNLFFISPMQFKGYAENILCLNLSRNGFSAAPNGTEFTLLPSLTYLDLSYNKVDLAYDYAFSELKHLEVLDLSYNNHYFTVAGVTHNFNFLEQLPALRVLNLSNNAIFTLTTKQMRSNSLNELQFHHNQLHHMWGKGDTTYHNLFTNLTNLTYLDISYNGIENFPSEVFKSLPRYIRKLSLSHNSLTYFQWNNLSSLQYLEELDLSHNSLSAVFSNLSSNTKSLSVLDLSYNRIFVLTEGFINSAKSLQLLDLSRNQLSTFTDHTFPSGSDTYLKTLQLHGNPFHCTCHLLDFLRWLNGSSVDIPRLATTVTCYMPEGTRGKPVIKVIDEHQCSSLEFEFFILSTLLILLTLCTATTMHLFYWDASYVAYYVKAKLLGYHSLNSSNSMYDAFVSYDTSDPLVSEWVLTHLCAQLEETGDKSSPICLEERDWTPGVPVLDNLTQSIYQSRKTVFVLTESYVKSGNFRMAVYLAHQRLLDDNEDVIVLLLLEPVLQDSHFLRLRRRLCSRSILEWPKTPAAEPWFWQCLRNAIHVDNESMYNKVYSRYFCEKDKRIDYKKL